MKKNYTITHLSALGFLSIARVKSLILNDNDTQTKHAH